VLVCTALVIYWSLELNTNWNQVWVTSWALAYFVFFVIKAALFATIRKIILMFYKRKKEPEDQEEDEEAKEEVGQPEE